MDIKSLRVKIFVDSADLTVLQSFVSNPLVSGVTTNPTLARKAGVSQYLTFAKECVATLPPDWCLSFEVVSDEDQEMIRQARLLADLGSNVWVKIPIMHADGRDTAQVIRTLDQARVNLNITAIFTAAQVHQAIHSINLGSPAILSIFAGRIADAGVDPIPVVELASNFTRTTIKRARVLWASARQPYNLIDAERAGASIICLFPEFVRKLGLFGTDLTEFSRQTVEMFVRDAQQAGYSL